MEHAPFDRADIVDVMADSTRQKVAMVAMDALTDPAFSRLDHTDQIFVLMAGMLTGVVGTMFAMVRHEDKDVIMTALAAMLPEARALAESVRGAEDLH